VLDNLARIIYIVNDPAAASATYTKGARKDSLIRDWIDWGELCRHMAKVPAHFKRYSRPAKSKTLKGIINLRNGFAHGWAPPFRAALGIPVVEWPIAVRTARNFYWPHDEHEVSRMKRKYRGYMPTLGMMSQDLDFMEGFQNQIFGKLTRDIRRFEKHNRVVIV
jgi:hypothetical protein